MQTKKCDIFLQGPISVHCFTIICNPISFSHVFLSPCSVPRAVCDFLCLSCDYSDVAAYYLVIYIHYYPKANIIFAFAALFLGFISLKLVSVKLVIPIIGLLHATAPPPYLFWSLTTGHIKWWWWEWRKDYRKKRPLTVFLFAFRACWCDKHQ